MNTEMIEGLIINDARVISDNRGRLFKIMSRSQGDFDLTDEVYISETLSGVVKGWKLHKEMVQNFFVPKGQLKLVIYDSREQSKTFGVVSELILSSETFQRVQIPSNVWYSFKTISQESSFILNCATLEHDPSETLGKPIDSPDIPFRW